MHLVTGATGFIGGQLVRRLVAQGESVRALVRPSSDRTELEELGVEIAFGDLADGDSVKDAMSRAKIVFHCGGLVSDWGHRSSFQSANVEGTRHVVAAAASLKVQRLVYLSSAAVYGYRRSNMVGESAPFESRGIPYIESKIAAEQIVQEAIRQRQIDAVILRPVMVFGPRCQTYVGEVVRHLKQGNMLLLDRGRHNAGLAYVENVVDACMLASCVDAIKNRAFNIHDDSNATWKDYIAALATGVGVKVPSFSLPTWMAYRVATLMELGARMLRREQRPLLTRLAVLELGQPQEYDISLARQELGYQPTVDFDSAMNTTLDWVRNSL